MSEHSRSMSRMMAVIVFVDIMDSAELSNVLSYEEYDEFLLDFQDAVTDVLERHLFPKPRYATHLHRRFEASVRGDELCVIIYPNTPPNRELSAKKEESCRIEDTKMALRLAIEIKRRWVTSKQNETRIRGGKSLIDVGIGINSGYVMVGPHRRVDNGKIVTNAISAEGYAINLAKRIEGYSRTGNFSKIFVSQRVHSTLSTDFQIAFDSVALASFKGIAQPVPVYEIKSFGHVEGTAFAPQLSKRDVEIYRKAIDHNPHEMWLVLDLAHHYFDKEEYNEAASSYKLALEVDPGFAPAHMYLGRSRYRDFHDVQARAHLERARELNPESARANNFLGVCLRRLAFRMKHPEAPAEHAPRSEWQALYQQALEYHKTAMRIAEQTPEKYQWAFNAFAMTLSQAIHEDAWELTPLERHKRLEEALSKVDDVLKLHQERQQNLLHHVRGFVLGADGRRDDAKKEFEKAVKHIEANYQQSPKKYREKLAEIEFHRGLLNICPRTAVYRKAFCIAYVGDLLRENHSHSEAIRDSDTRESFVSRQYWYHHVYTDMKGQRVSVDEMLRRCKECVAGGRKCVNGQSGCSPSTDSAGKSRVGGGRLSQGKKATGSKAKGVRVHS